MATGAQEFDTRFRNSGDDLQQSQVLEPSYGEGKEDPAGVLNQADVESLRQLAIQLSSDRTWLTKEVLKGLDTLSVRLDEVFAEAPAFVELDGQLYRVVLEKVGPGWKKFDARSSKYIVFLNHEAYDGLGENYALGFERGKERVVTREDIQKAAAIGLTLRGVTPDERPKSRQGVVDIDSPIRLGKVRPRFRSANVLDFEALERSQTSAKSCQAQAAPSSCSNGVPVCSSPTATPYFVLSSILIKKDLEDDIFQGSPEIELFPLRINLNSPYGGSSDVRTNWIFDGRYVTDLAGRSRNLPNVNDENQWYPINGGLALYPASLGGNWATTLVENDETTGKLEVNRDKYNQVKSRDAMVKLIPFDLLDFLKGLAELIYTLGSLPSSDDIFTPSLEVNNAAFCSESLGQAFPHTLTFTGDEWNIQGHFACIDPTCVPPPPPDPCNGSYCCGRPGCIEP